MLEKIGQGLPCAYILMKANKDTGNVMMIQG